MAVDPLSWLLAPAILQGLTRALAWALVEEKPSSGW